MPRLSFIITAFNRPALLRVCLASLVTQSCIDWEAIVVDNSDAVHAARNYDLCAMDDRIAYENVRSLTAIDGAIHTHSLYKATEFGVASAEGEFLCFPSDDSYYVPGFAARMLRRADEDTLDLVYCDIVLGSPAGYYGVLGAAPTLCNIDKTNFIVRRDWFEPFDSDPINYPQADGLFVESLVRRGAKHVRVADVLVVHN